MSMLRTDISPKYFFKSLGESSAMEALETESHQEMLTDLAAAFLEMSIYVKGVFICETRIR